MPMSLGALNLRRPSTVRIERLPTAILALGPFAYWKLDETSGIVAIDSVGGNNGVYSADVVFGERVDTFNHPVPNFWKTTSTVTVPDFNEASLSTNGITVICLAQVVASQVGASPSGMAPFVKSGEWACSFPSFHSFASENNTGGSLYRATEDISPAVGSNFGLFVWVYPASTSLDPIIYVGGSPVGTGGFLSGTRIGNTGSALVLGAGQGNLSSHSTFKGRFINNAALYNRELTPTEIGTLFTAYSLDYPL